MPDPDYDEDETPDSDNEEGGVPVPSHHLEEPIKVKREVGSFLRFIIPIYRPF